MADNILLKKSGIHVNAALVDTDTTNFNDILSVTEDTVQKALDALDDGAVNVAGDTMTGNLDLGGNNLLDVGDIALDTISSATGTSISVLLGTDAGDDFIVGNNNAFVVTGDNDRIAMGHNTPESLLHLSGIGDVELIIEADSDNSGENDNPTLRLRQDGGTNSALFGMNGMPDALYTDALGNAAFMEAKNGQELQLVTGATTATATDGVARMTMLSNGFIGLGHNAPQVELHIKTASSPSIVVEDTTNTTQIQIQAQNDFAFIGTLTAHPYLFVTSGVPQGVISTTGLFGFNELNPDATVEIVTKSSTEEGLKIKGSAGQTGSLFNIVRSDDAIYITSGDGLAGSEFRGNDQGVDIDFVWESVNEDKLFLIDAGNDEVRMGDGDTNYTSIKNTGVQTMVGTARVIINDDVEITVPAKGLASPPDDGEEDNFTTLDFDDGTDEEIFFEYHIRHNYSPGGLIHIHVHFFTDAVPGGADETVEWSLEYKKVSEGEAFDFSSGTSSTTATQVLTSGDTVTEIYETQALVLTTTDFQPDDHILMRLHRNGGVGNDDYVGDARLFRIHIEYLSDKLGEAT